MRGKGQKAGIGKLFFLLEKDRGRYLFFVFANAAFFSAAAMLAGSLCAMTAACFCKKEKVFGKRGGC